MNATRINQELTAFLSDEDGAVAVEYALLAALIALAIIGGAAALGTELNDYFNAVATKLAEIFDLFN